MGHIGGEMRTRKAAKQVNISITKVPAEVLAALRERAKANNRSLAGEVRAILAECLDQAEGRVA